MKPSFCKIVSADYLTLLSLLFPAMFWLIYVDSVTIKIAHSIMGRGNQSIDSDVFIWMSVAVSILFMPTFIVRILNIYKHFASSEIVDGKILMIRLFKDRGRIEYLYEYNGVRYRAGNGIHRNAYILSLKEGDDVELAVSKKNPKRALIKNLYVV